VSIVSAAHAPSRSALHRDVRRHEARIASSVPCGQHGTIERVDAERALVDRCRAGDRAAFDVLARTHEARVRGLVRRYVRNDADVSDVVQRVFVRVFERIHAFRGEASFATWLCRIAINVALNHVRGDAAEGWVALEDDVAFTTCLETSKLVAAELWRKVSARLEELPPKQRMVVELRVFHDLSFEEIGDVVGCGEEAAKANYHHAVKRLRELVPGVGAF
jgi:RNA polymerase sigma-70 factor (ECF subfamily)